MSDATLLHRQIVNAAAKRSLRHAVTSTRMFVVNGSTGAANGSGGNAQRSYERYVTLGREAAAVGDTVEMENCYQHAEHFFRAMRG